MHAFEVPEYKVKIASIPLPTLYSLLLQCCLCTKSINSPLLIHDKEILRLEKDVLQHQIPRNSQWILLEITPKSTSFLVLYL